MEQRTGRLFWVQMLNTRTANGVILNPWHFKNHVTLLHFYSTTNTFWDLWAQNLKNYMITRTAEDITLTP